MPSQSCAQPRAVSEAAAQARGRQRRAVVRRTSLKLEKMPAHSCVHVEGKPFGHWPPGSSALLAAHGLRQAAAWLATDRSEDAPADAVHLVELRRPVAAHDQSHAVHRRPLRLDGERGKDREQSRAHDARQHHRPELRSGRVGEPEGPEPEPEQIARDESSSLLTVPPRGSLCRAPPDYSYRPCGSFRACGECFTRPIRTFAGGLSAR